MKPFKLTKKSGGEHFPIYVRKKLKPPTSMPLILFRHCRPLPPRTNVVIELPQADDDKGVTNSAFLIS